MTFRYYAIIISAICIAVFLVQSSVPGFTEAFLLNEGAWVEVYRFVTSIFLHGDLTHLIYNIFALALFGSILERLIGSNRFLLVYFATGIGANLVAVNFYSASLGASGAIFGILGCLVLLRPTLTVWAFGMPMPLFIAAALWVGGDIIGTFIPSNVGTIAHLAGIFFGAIFGAIYRNWRREKKTRFVLDESVAREWEKRYMR